MGGTIIEGINKYVKTEGINEYIIPIEIMAVNK
jgi:hypothetical protein